MEEEDLYSDLESYSSENVEEDDESVDPEPDLYKSSDTVAIILNELTSYCRQESLPLAENITFVKLSKFIEKYCK